MNINKITITIRVILGILIVVYWIFAFVLFSAKPGEAVLAGFVCTVLLALIAEHINNCFVRKTCIKKTPPQENDFFGNEARYYFLYPTPTAVEKINTLLKDLPPENFTEGIDGHPDEPQTLSLDETTRKIEKYLYESYVDELLDLKAGEESFFAGYFIFVDHNVLSVQICYMTEFSGGAIFFGVDAVRCDTDVFKVWIPDISHSADEISAELTSVKAAISNGSWQDPCCALKEQVTAWAREKNIME